MKSKLRKIILMSAIFCLFAGLCVRAAEPGDILSFFTGEKEITLYIADPGEEPTVDCQIGTSKAREVEVHPISEDQVPVETVFLVDNSLSVRKNYRPLISQCISEIAANRMPGEEFSLAVFSDHMEFLVEQSSDYAAVKQAADGITYQDQDTYLTDVLYHLLKNYENEAESKFRRIVIFSDGVDDNSLGITKDELYTLLESRPVPVYTLGCSNSGNQEQLKNMFALSRITRAEFWLMDDILDPMTVVTGIAGTNRTQKVTVYPKESDCDGSRKGLALSISAGENNRECSIEVTMPFVLVEETETETEMETVRETETVKVTETAAEVFVEEEEEEEEEGPDFRKILIISLIGLAAAGGIASAVILIARASKKKKLRKQFKQSPPSQPASAPASKPAGRENGVHTVFLGDNQTRAILNDRGDHRLILEDSANPARSYEASLKAPVTIGYDSDCTISIQYENTVSGKHCQIYEENGRFYVRNLSHTNITRLDGNKVPVTAELYSGSTITLGRLNLKAEIR